jgi:hypothetical protein
MNELNVQKSIKTGVLSFEDLWVFSVIGFLYNLLLRGLLVMLLGMFFITVLAFNDVWPTYSMEFIFVSSISVGLYQSLIDRKLKKIPLIDKSQFIDNLESYFNGLGWAVILSNENCFHACEAFHKRENHAFIIYNSNNVLVSSVFGLPYPFSLLASQKVIRDIEGMAKLGV